MAIQTMIWLDIVLTTVTLAVLVVYLARRASTARPASALTVDLRRELTSSREEIGRHIGQLRTELTLLLQSALETQRTSIEQGLDRVRAAIEQTSERDLAAHTEYERSVRSELSASRSLQEQALSSGLAQVSDRVHKNLEILHTVVSDLQQATNARLDSVRASLEQSVKEFTKSLDTRLLEDTRSRAANEAAFRRELQESRSTQERLLSDGLTQVSGRVQEQLRGFQVVIGDLQRTSTAQLEGVRKVLEASIQNLQSSNERKLDEMRRTVDDKLESTLTARLGASFAQVSERLEKVYTGLGEMRALASGVDDLKRVMTNVKARGTWGEVQLGNLLEEMLTADQYIVGAEVRPHSAYKVDFAIRLPSRDGDPYGVLLPIDASFPQEDYQRLLDAYERGDSDAAKMAGRNLEVGLKREAQSISEKYINPPTTVNFAILFVPVEGLYAELIRRPGLVDGIQRDFRVLLAGPSTLAALLNSLQMGFRTLAIQKRSSEVWEVLGAVKAEFGKFGLVLDKVQKKLTEANNVMDAARTRTRAMDRKLRTVEELPGDDASRLLELPRDRDAAEDRDAA